MHREKPHKLLQVGVTPVSYTHLDVYKRQAELRPLKIWRKRDRPIKDSPFPLVTQGVVL